MASARINLPPDLEGIHLFQLEDCIRQANLGAVDRDMARMYLIGHMPQVEIAAELGYSRTTVGKRIKKAVDKIAATNRRLYSRLN